VVCFEGEKSPTKHQDLNEVFEMKNETVEILDYIYRCLTSSKKRKLAANFGIYESKDLIKKITIWEESK